MTSLASSTPPILLCFMADVIQGGYRMIALNKCVPILLPFVNSSGGEKNLPSSRIPQKPVTRGLTDVPAVGKFAIVRGGQIFPQTGRSGNRRIVRFL
jgi:hypothetical protein